ncbi:MAG TPA: hypothetical protein VFO42_06925 [Sphingomicrobium sp.]|nr:hypothetical protein [Sphingomicrobium sp.]
MIAVMRRIMALSLMLVAVGCARTPQPEPVGQAPVKPASGPVSALIGLSASELISHFGQPRLQVREGPGVKLQWASSGCVLDVYLYPEGAQGRERATHVDSRRPSGDSIDQRSCVELLRP